jgi:hypothetical protein
MASRSCTKFTSAAPNIKVLDRAKLDLTTPSGRGILALLTGLAEKEGAPCAGSLSRMQAVAERGQCGFSQTFA